MTVVEEIPTYVFLPLFIVLTAAVLYQRRHRVYALLVFLGLKEKK